VGRGNARFDIGETNISNVASTNSFRPVALMDPDLSPTRMFLSYHK